ncbi:MAG: hypothetical protein COA57_12755 [Flavobacteriales bacterium]|nr:hypothetical protein [Bacteroidales bacterium AH-315-I05]PCJ82865.1 MAG: hypothetical protein COA57_12755 [Flavobacteriales bacterium]
MKIKVIAVMVLVMAAIVIAQVATSEYYYHPEFNKNGNGLVYAYPPAVGIIGNAKNCLACHSDKGPWKDKDKTIIDVLDKSTKKSLKQPDGSFLIEVKRNEIADILTVIGRTADDNVDAPYRNAFLYVDPTTIGTTSLSKFAPGWNVNLPMSCKIVGDKLEGYEGAKITVVPSSIRPTDVARDAELSLQVLLTKGGTEKGNALAGISNYYEKKVKLKVID